MQRLIQVLLADDYPPFRSLVRSMLEKRPDLQVVGEVSDGMEAIQKVQELRPDLIVLDISLPTLNGIEVARRIRQLSASAKILFVSANRDWETAADVLGAGSIGYVVKSSARKDLLLAVESLLQGKDFVSPSLLGTGRHNPTSARLQNYPDHSKPGTLVAPQSTERGCCHEAGFYSDDRWFIEDVTQFIGTALKAGNAAIVVATESHRQSLFLSLQAFGLDVSAAVTQGRYNALDASKVLSTFMLHGMPDPDRFTKAFADLIQKAAAAATVQPPRVAIFGECVNLLSAEGNNEAAIQIEKLGSQLVNTYQVDILCGYSLENFRGMVDNRIYQRIVAEHSAVFSR